MILLIYTLLKLTLIEVEFALASLIVGLLLFAKNKLKKKKSYSTKQDDETHWI